MMMAAVGAGMSALGSIAGGIMASNAAKKQKRMIEQQRKDNQRWFDKRYYEDPTQNASAQRMLTQANEQLLSKSRNAAGNSAVMGATDAATALRQESGNKMYADLLSSIAAQGEARKADIEKQYREEDAALNQQLVDLEGQRAQAISGAIQGVTGAGSSLMGG